jgi:cellulose synthase/poly-beta-1,6-N-acetylglucosamine synthase-like glycosyltransferase
VSIVIAAHNEEKVILTKIKNLAAMDYPKELIEIIIGSDGSDDATVNILTENSLSCMKIFDFKERRGKVNVLKDLVNSAKGEILVFSDANTMYEPDAVKRLAAHFSDLGVGCVCGRLKLRSPDNVKEGEYEGIYWRYESAIKRMEGELGAVLGANGGIYAIRKELFPEIPNNTIVEDFVIPMKILERGYKTLYEKDAVAYEDSSKTIADEGRRKIRIGAGDYQTLFLTLPMLNIFRGFSSFAYWSHKVIRWFVPFLMIIILGMNILLAHILLYKYLLIGQALFYSGAVIGYLINKTRMHNRIFSLLYYFVAMNLSLLVGFLRFVTGGQQVTWKRVAR